jgi:hypothetical protein
MIFLEIMQAFSIIVAIYNIYVSSMAINWISNIEEYDSDSRLMGFIRIHAPMVFRMSIIASVVYILLMVLLVGNSSETMIVNHADYASVAYNLLVQLLFVRVAQFALFSEQCHKKRIIIPIIKFRFSIPIYQNKNKEYF